MGERKLYPRPELVRESWQNLCGEWEFDFDFGKSARERGVTEAAHLEKKINELRFGEVIYTEKQKA